jgi:hypothetical protein
MFNWLRALAQPKPPSPIRDTLFGDMPLAKWAHGEEAVSPWSHFARAQRLLDARDTAGAIEVLRKVIATPDFESRHYLEAWSELRKLGVAPSEREAHQTLGVVVEVSLDQGLDLLAAYADHTARYFNFSGAAVIWEHLNDSINPHIDRLLKACAPIPTKIGAWEKPRPPAPPTGQARLNVLTPAGLFFGQAPLEALLADPLAGPAMQAATELMLALMEKAKAARAKP